MRNGTLILVIVLLISTTSSAQILGVNYAMIKARGEFNQNIDRDPAGFAINYVHSLGEAKRFAVGGELGVAMYANKTYELIVPGRDPLKMYEEDCFWTIHALGQYMLHRTPSFQLYAEGRLGMTTFFSEKHVMEDVDGDFEDYDETRTHGTAFNMGLGGGLRYNLSGLIKGDPLIYDRVWIQMAAVACSGTRTEYRNAGEGVISLASSSYRSLTNYTNIHFGVAFNFGD